MNAGERGFARWFCAALLILLSSACSVPLQPASPTETQTVAPTAALSSTPTIDWFPTTATPTVYTTSIPPTATLLPTPPAGTLIFKDDFSHPGQWLTGQFTVGAIAYGGGALGLAISQPQGVLISTRTEPVLTDFYLEITATPSLCLNGDNYGVQFRMSSSIDFYRFLLSCAGQVRLERLKGGTGQVLHDWSLSAQALPNPGGRYRLAVWAVGQELRLYIGGVLQFSVQDGSLSSGGLGLFARSVGSNPVTVAFSDLEVYQPGNP